MIALFTFRPAFCPHCGRPIKHTQWNAQDYDARASFRCPSPRCGLNYQLVDEDAALDAAELDGGDLKRMVRS